jgi:hypothetical protein
VREAGLHTVCCVSASSQPIAPGGNSDSRQGLSRYQSGRAYPTFRTRCGRSKRDAPAADLVGAIASVSLLLLSARFHNRRIRGSYVIRREERSGGGLEESHETFAPDEPHSLAGKLGFRFIPWN